MAEISNEVLYEELLKLDASIQTFEREMQETLAVFREPTANSPKVKPETTP